VAFWGRLGFRPRIVQMVVATDGVRVADPTGVDRSSPGSA
jgi:hypothetical protein